MKKYPPLLFIPAILSALITSAHFMRFGHTGEAASILSLLLLLFVKDAWVKNIMTLLLTGAAVFWIVQTKNMIELRIAYNEPWLRPALILGGVSALCFGAAHSFNSKTADRIYQSALKTATLSTWTFITTAAILGAVQIKMPMLITERFFKGAGWIEIILLAAWSAILINKMSNPKESAKWRKRAWLLFSSLFFLQLLLGLFASDLFLMSSKLHVPVPAIIIAGPIYRGSGFFMPILLASTLLLAGPVWCSQLCYYGALDIIYADRKKHHKQLPAWHMFARSGILGITIITALIFNLLGISTSIAAITGLSFGITGLAITIFISKKTGTMTHCTVFCPVGLVVQAAGKISPFRIKFKEGCDSCGICTQACKVNALESINIDQKKVGFNCTLCGDCIGKCPKNQLQYTFGSISSPKVRTAFLFIAVVLHSVFMGLAKL